MAGDTLESRFVIQDEASKVLENIAKQSEIAGDALAEVQDALHGLQAAGEVSVHTAIKDEINKRRETANRGNTQETLSADEDTIDISLLEEINARNEEAWLALVNETEEMANEILNAINEAAADEDTIDISLLEEINARNEEAWREVVNETEEMSNAILNAYEEIENEIAETVEGAQEEAEHAGSEVEEDLQNISQMMEGAQEEAEQAAGEIEQGISGLGADLAGWLSIIKDVFGKIADAFEELAEKSDKLNMRIARFGLVADNEGKTGTARGERSEELYRQHQKFSQALGVQSEAFNDTVMTMYSNGEGVVKSIEEAQAIAASSYMAMDIAGLRGADKDAVMGEVQSMVNVGIADADQIQESMKIAPNILRTIEKQWQKNQNGKAYKLSSGEEITDATGKIATLAQEGQITAELVSQAMVNSAEDTQKTWQQLPSTWEKIKNRVGVIVENMTYNIMKKFGEIADNPQVANFIMAAMELGKRIVKFIEKYIIPFVGAAITAIGSTLTTLMDTINNINEGLTNWQTAIPIIIGLGAALVAVAVKTGLVTKAIAAIKTALLAITANPLLLVAAVAIGAALAIAHLVRTTQTGQEIMLEVTAAISMAFQQVGAAIMNIPGIIKSAFRGVQSFISSYVTGILKIVASALEKLASLSDTARDAAMNLRNAIAEREAENARFDMESEELKKGWKGEFSANWNQYQDYRSRIPKMAAQNLTKSKDELKLTGFLEDILNGVKNAPGGKNNPANVKGKVSIDGEYFDIIKRAAGVEIVNRYTTLRPTVNATFGDIHQMDAGEVIGELGKQIKEAEDAAISDAQGLGA